MYELTGNITNASVSYQSGRAILTLEFNEKDTALKMYDELKNVEKLAVKINKWREKRSLNANNYAWKLITEIANVLRGSKDETYRLMLERYGQSEIISVKANIPIKDFIQYIDEVGSSSLNGTLFKHYKVYKGSSQYDTQEMSIFIDGIVGEAKALGIPTETPEQIANLKNLWGEQ
jgi:hypothetical protein